MKTIEVDDAVFAHIQRHALAFVDTPNSTCRRLFQLDSPDSKPLTALADPVRSTGREKDFDRAGKRSKAPKADVVLLIEKGLLREGQTLYLIDYQSNRVQKFAAIISGSDLIYNNKRFSMSGLAQELLAEVGFTSNFVRGPAHWATEEGKSIKDLWQQFLVKNAGK